MSDIKKFINYIKKMWKNKKTRSIAILLMYSIFMLIIIFIIRLNKDEIQNNLNKNTIENVQKEEITSNENIINQNNLKYYDNYKYDMEIVKDINVRYKISNNNEENKINYYIYDTNTNNYDIIETISTDIIKLDLDYVLYLINNTEDEYTTNYKDGTLLSAYNIKINDILCDTTVRYNHENYISNISIKLNELNYKITITRK